jgi:hypothetical protein
VRRVNKTKKEKKKKKKKKEKKTNYQRTFITHSFDERVQKSLQELNPEFDSFKSRAEINKNTS